jgi:hypothetical protein
MAFATPNLPASFVASASQVHSLCETNLVAFASQLRGLCQPASWPSPANFMAFAS